MPATADCLHGGGRTCPTSPATCCWSAFPAPSGHGSHSHRGTEAEPAASVSRRVIQQTLAAAHLPGIRAACRAPQRHPNRRSEEHTSELQSLMRNSYAVFCLKKKKQK